MAVNVAMLQSSLPPARSAGGVGYQVDLLARALAERHHSVTVFVVDDPPSPDTYRCVQIRIPEGRARRIYEVGRAYARLDLAEFDVVHAHGDDWLFGRRPRIRTFYGTALMEARFATSWSRRGAQLAYYVLECISSLNPCSVAISNTTRRYLPLVRSCVPCAFDPLVFFAGAEESEEPSILCVAGTLKGRKRGDLLLRAFEEVRRAIPTARLTIVSRDHAEGPGISREVGLTGEELGNLYRSHWLLCSTSSYEGFGLPYVEAMASGLPIVTTANEGALEVLQGGELGVVTSPKNLGRSIITLLRDPTKRRTLSTRGLEAARPYTVSAVASQYEALYQTICQNLDPSW